MERAGAIMNRRHELLKVNKAVYMYCAYWFYLTKNKVISQNSVTLTKKFCWELWVGTVKYQQTCKMNLLRTSRYGATIFVKKVLRLKENSIV